MASLLGNQIIVRNSKDQAEFLMKPDNMKGQYLGECLDSSRSGSETTVMYKMSVYDMISFIQNWMEQNEGNFQDMFNEKEEQKNITGCELPYIDYKACPRDEDHKDMIKDFNGNLRCAHMEIKKIKLIYTVFTNFFDDISRINVRKHIESRPLDGLPDEAWGDRGEIKSEWLDQWNEYMVEIMRFENEEPTLEIKERCLAIISEKYSVLPLETILKRLKLNPDFETVYCSRDHETCERQDELDEHKRDMYELTGYCQGHDQPVQELVFDFDGYFLAAYIQLWYNQMLNGQAPLYKE